jgi:hypothetical protein
MLLDVSHRQLHLEIVRILLGDLLQPKENRFQPAQVVHLLDLLV